MSKLLIVFLLVLLTGCNYSIQKMPIGGFGGDQAISRLPPGTIPGYQLIASAIIAPKCLECHSSGGGNAGGVNLETYSAVISGLASIRDEVTSRRMPKNRGPLTAAQREIFLTWIDAGGPEEAPTPIPPEVLPDPDTIDYAMVKTKVIDLRCIGCHSVKGGDKGGVNLESYENVLREINAIKEQVANGGMPRPRNKPLTDIQKRMFLLWIDLGAPETRTTNN